MSDDKIIDSYLRIPNIAVQNITHNNVTDNSYVQLFGKKAVAYIRSLLLIQNMRGYVYFTINMILSMLNISKNIFRERKYFKDFLMLLINSQLIECDRDINCLNPDEVICLKLNIYEYDDNNNITNFFMLKDSDFDLINGYSGDLDKYNLLNLFCNINSRIKRNPKDTHIADKFPEVCYPSYQTIKDDIFIENDSTLKKYIDTLQDMDLIRYKSCGDMIFKIDGQQPIRKKANFTYILYAQGCEEWLEQSVTNYRSKKRKDGWSFLSDVKEQSADESRSLTQKINYLENLKVLTQQQKKDLAKLKRKKARITFNIDVDVRKLEETKLKNENPNKDLSEIYEEMGYTAKADRAFHDEIKQLGVETLKCINCGKKTDRLYQNWCRECSIKAGFICEDCGEPLEPFVDYCQKCKSEFILEPKSSACKKFNSIFTDAENLSEEGYELFEIMFDKYKNKIASMSDNEIERVNKQMEVTLKQYKKIEGIEEKELYAI